MVMLVYQRVINTLQIRVSRERIIFADEYVQLGIHDSASGESRNVKFLPLDLNQTSSESSQ